MGGPLKREIFYFLAAYFCLISLIFMRISQYKTPQKKPMTKPWGANATSRYVIPECNGMAAIMLTAEMAIWDANAAPRAVMYQRLGSGRPVRLIAKKLMGRMNARKSEERIVIPGMRHPQNDDAGSARV